MNLFAFSIGLSLLVLTTQPAMAQMDSPFELNSSMTDAIDMPPVDDGPIGTTQLPDNSLTRRVGRTEQETNQWSGVDPIETVDTNSTAVEGHQNFKRQLTTYAPSSITSSGFTFWQSPTFSNPPFDKGWGYMTGRGSEDLISAYQGWLQVRWVDCFHLIYNF